MARAHSSLKLALAAAALVLLVTAVSAFAAYEVLMSSTNAQLRTFLGASKAKLVYVNYWNGTYELHYVDFSEGDGEPVVHKIAAATGTDGPKVPVISPDGNWVVYAKGPGGEFGSSLTEKSSAYVCKLEEGAQPVRVMADSAHEPRWLWNASTPTIIFPTIAPDLGWEANLQSGGSSVPNPGTTLKLEINTGSGTPQPGTPQLVANRAYTGGLSWDERYLCGGGRLVAMLDLQGDGLPDTTGPIAYGKPEAVSGQACNASISSSRKYTNTMLYLDFGTGAKRWPGVNDSLPWGKWQVIVLTDIDGTPLRSYGYPRNPEHPLETLPDSSFSKAKWHHNEWSNHPYYCTATLNADRYFLINGNYQNTANQERIYLINLNDSAYAEVMRPKTIEYTARSGGLYWPGLWVDMQGFVEEDGWLATSTRDRTRMERARGGISLTGSILTSSIPIREATIYRADGSRVASTRLRQAGSRLQMDAIGRLSAGTYFIEVTSLTGTTQTVRLTSVK